MRLCHKSVRCIFGVILWPSCATKPVSWDHYHWNDSDIEDNGKNDSQGFQF